MRLSDDGTSVDDWGEPSPRVSFLALPRAHTPGHELPLPEDGSPVEALPAPAGSGGKSSMQLG